MTIPYTYVLNAPNGKRYYGVRFAKDCDPSDFWVSYFTSSKEVASLISVFGKENFTFEIRKCFTSIDEAREWETTVLRRLRVIHNDKWINKTYSLALIGIPHSEETKQKISNSHRGLRHSTETKLKISISRKGSQISDATRAKMSKPKPQFTCPNCKRVGGIGAMIKHHGRAGEKCKYENV
jgi:hypothetical protein